MAVTDVFETMPWGAGGDYELEDSNEGRRAVRTFIVLLDGTDDNDDVPHIALYANGVPEKNDPHPDSNFGDTRMARKWVELTKSWQMVLVVCEYGSDADSGRTSNLSPYDDPWEIDFPDEVDKEIVEITKTDLTGGGWSGVFEAIASGEPVVNAAGDWFDPPIEENFYPASIVCVKNVPISDIDLEEIKLYRGTINDAPITIADYELDQWEGRLIGYSAKFMDDRGELYYKLRYKISLKEDFWVRTIINRGWRIIKNGELKRATLRNGGSLQSPANLTQDGTAIIEDGDTGDINYRVFGLIQDADWSSLTTVPPTTKPS